MATNSDASSTPTDDDDDEQQQQQRQQQAPVEKTGTQKEQANALKRLDADDDVKPAKESKVDKKKMTEGLNQVLRLNQENKQKRIEAQQLLDAVKVNEGDVEICMNECQLSRPDALRLLQTNGGDLERALLHVISSSNELVIT